MIKKICFILITCSCITMFSLNSLAKEGAGTTAADFLRVGVGARAAGMGEAFTAVCDDVYSIYWNPAGLANQITHSLTMMHTMWFASSYDDFIGYSTNTHKFGTLGLAVHNFNAGKIKETDETGVEKGEFSPTDMALNLAYGREFFQIPVGVNLKYISSQITKKASTVTFDVGLRYNFQDLFELGLAGQNLAGRLKYAEKENPLPRTWKFGLKGHLLEAGICALDLVYPRGNSPYLNVGVELNGQLANKRMAFRMGYSTKNIKKTEGLSNLSSGLGFGMGNLDVDYAWVPFGDLGNTHRISINFSFPYLEIDEKIRNKAISHAEKLMKE